MIELFDSEIQQNERQSSKGNQLKWRRNSEWYKADYAGYEGLSEYVISELLRYSDLCTDTYVKYQTTKIRYRAQVFNGCVSENFLPAGRQLITLERLFRNHSGASLLQALYQIVDVKERFRFLVDTTERLTGLSGAADYYCAMFAIDALFLNEDRHLHNVAVITDGCGTYEYCPIFDNGAALLSDTTMDYPLGEDIYDLIASVKSKTISDDFEEQLEAAEIVCGQTPHFSFAEKEIDLILQNETAYDMTVKDRMKRILLEQRRKYAYLFV